MKVKVITETLTNLEIAERQLDRAISLFFDEEDCISALTLAGAAEEILGKLLTANGNSHCLDEIIDFSLKFQNIDTGDQRARKEVSNIANFFRNRLKHFNAQGEVTFSVDFYAAEVIERATTNYWNYTGEETPPMIRFKEEVLLGKYYEDPNTLLNHGKNT